MGNVSEKHCGKNQNAHFVFIVFFFNRKLCSLWDNLGKYSEAGQATEHSMPHTLRAR